MTPSFRFVFESFQLQRLIRSDDLIAYFSSNKPLPLQIKNRKFDKNFAPRVKVSIVKKRNSGASFKRLKNRIFPIVDLTLNQPSHDLFSPITFFSNNCHRTDISASWEIGSAAAPLISMHLSRGTFLISKSTPPSFFSIRTDVRRFADDMHHQPGRNFRCTWFGSLELSATYILWLLISARRFSFHKIFLKLDVNVLSNRY